VPKQPKQPKQKPPKKKAPKRKHREPKVGPLGKIHGGKGDGKARMLAELHPDLDSFDKHVEPCGGLASVKMNLDIPAAGRIDIYNDINERLVNMFRQIRNNPEAMCIALQTTLYSEADFALANNPQHYEESNPIEQARLTYIQYAMSFSGRMDQFSRTTKRIRRGMASEVSAHLTKIDETLPMIVEIVRRWSIENWDIATCIKKHDGPKTMFYIDPPYMLGTRSKGARAVYDYEMTDEQHEELLKVLQDVKGKVLLSGYYSELYQSKLKAPQWHSYGFAVNNQATGPGQPRPVITEHVWTNYVIKPKPKWLVKL